MTPEMMRSLQSWAVFNKMMGDFSEEEVKELLDFELAHVPRWNIVERLHQRWTRLRGARERIELKKIVNESLRNSL